jgi:hypothetical protein
MLNNIGEIFRLYGGWNAIRQSSYVRWSVVLSLFLWTDALSGSWAVNVADYLPPVLGFSFAALAIMTAIGDDEFRRLMAKVDTIQDGESDLTVVTANFSWFILVQIFAVVLSLIYSAKPFPYVISSICRSEACELGPNLVNVSAGFIGNFLLVYSLLLIVAAISQMLTVFRLYLSSVRSDAGASEDNGS